MTTSYCAHVRAHPEDGLHRAYHDTQYGFPLRDVNVGAFGLRR